jgi:hypothetical protein
VTDRDVVTHFWNVLLWYVRCVMRNAWYVMHEVVQGRQSRIHGGYCRLIRHFRHFRHNSKHINSLAGDAFTIFGDTSLNASLGPQRRHDDADGEPLRRLVGVGIAGRSKARALRYNGRSSDGLHD